YWQVETKDKDGNESTASQPATFVTNVGSQWQSLDGIWPLEQVSDDQLMANYRVEQTISIHTGDALAVLGHMDASGKNGYMIQVRNVDNVIKVHRIAGGKINTKEFALISLKESGVILPKDHTEFGFRIDFSGSQISFGMDTGAGYVAVGEVDVWSQGNHTYGVFGYRTGSRESGTIDDVRVTSLTDNSVLYQSDFGKLDEHFPGFSVMDGKLVIPTNLYQCYFTGTVQELANFAFFRSPRLTVDPKKVDKAVVCLATRGSAADRGMIADLYLNGVCLGVGSAREVNQVGSFAETSNYTKVFYNAFDATAYLQKGENVIGVAANSREASRGVLVQMTVFYKDGTKEIVTNSSVENSGWKMLDGSKAFTDIGNTIQTGYVSVLYDNVNMKEYPMDWYQVAYDDSGWMDAMDNQSVADTTEGVSNRVLTPYCSENTLRLAETLPGKTLYRTQQNTLLLDLGKEIVGGLKVNWTLPEDMVVTVRRGEELNKDGSVKYRLTAAPVYEDMWRLQKGENRFETLTMRTFRYVEFVGLTDEAITALLSQAEGISGWAMEQAFDPTLSAFEATDGSDAATLMNRLYELCKYTIKATNQDVFVDSQARERAPYEGDLLVNANTSYSVSDDYSLARHSNEWLIDNPTWPNDYSIFMVEMAYYDLLYTGDTRSIETYYEALTKKLTVKVKKQDALTGLVEVNNSQAGNTAIIDWPLNERDGYKGSTYDVVLNAEYVGIYRYMAAIARALGQEEDALYYEGLSDKVKQTLITYAYNKDAGCFYDSLSKDLKPTNHSSIHATAYALAYGVFDSQEMADQMCQYVYDRCKDEFVGSVYMSYFILKGLYKGNHGEMAQALLTIPTVGENVKTFASLLDDLNCTITPEAWGHKHKGNMTLSHPWGASPGCSIVQGMFGIYPTTPGFYTFDIKLQLGQIGSATVTVPSVQGSISASYAQTETGLSAAVVVPANTTATLWLPAEKQGELTVNGTPVSGEFDGHYMKVPLGSGNYTVLLKK
ncbi:MAG: family 78 glycoside hydrolase catalytic domain, partial [Clostridia bacterium]|nr:family 78 glycoside hydrolase catalytic domain [Clostridia bacterium]